MSKYLDSSKTRASICDWTLKFVFLNEDQIEKLLPLLMNEGHFSFQVEHDYGDSYRPQKFTVTISGCWAHNLKKVSKLIQEVDYSDE